MSNQKPVPRVANKTSRTRRGATKSRVVTENIPISVVRKFPPKREPIMRSVGRSFVVTNRELIGGITSSTTTFEVAKRYRVNPGSKATFPWLSNIAYNYESYRFRKLHFDWVARCPTTTDGAAILSPDYDAEDAAAVSEQQLAANVNSIERPVFSSFSLKLDPSRMNRLYKSHVVMSDSRFATTSQDTKTVDSAFVSIGLDTSVADVRLAKFWVDYEVEFYEPSFPTEDINDGSARVAISSSTASTVTPFATAPGILQKVLDPILQLDPTVSYPASEPLKVLRDWSGNVDLSGTGVNITDLPSILVNGIAQNVLEFPFPQNLVNTSLNQAFKSSFVELKEGDTFGAGGGTFNSLNNMYFRLSGTPNWGY